MVLYSVELEYIYSVIDIASTRVSFTKELVHKHLY